MEYNLEYNSDRPLMIIPEYGRHIQKLVDHCVALESDEERKKMALAPFSLDEYKKALDLSDIHGEDGYSTMERVGIRPTLDVNGIWGGYIGEGAKTLS